MNKTELLRHLSHVEGFEKPSVELEQYRTPPELAATVIWTAYMQGDLEGKVADLGAGTGMLGLGAALLDAEVTLVEKDPEALGIAKENMEALGVEAKIVESDVEDLDEEFDTVLMNPPFSVHSEQLEKFLDASAAADAVYTLCNSDSKEIERFYHRKGYSVSVSEHTVSLPATYGFHTEESRDTEIKLLVARKTD